MASWLKKKKEMLHAQSKGTFNEQSHGGDNMRRSGTPGVIGLIGRCRH
jgi:hypothetical protein